MNSCGRKNQMRSVFVPPDLKPVAYDAYSIELSLRNHVPLIVPVTWSSDSDSLTFGRGENGASVQAAQPSFGCATASSGVRSGGAPTWPPATHCSNRKNVVPMAVRSGTVVPGLVCV